MINRLDLALGNGNRPYQYKVSIVLPNAMVATLTLSQDKVDALCKKASLPDMQIEQTSIHVNGREFKVPFSTTYTSEQSLSFYLDDDFYLRHALEFWMISFDYYKFRDNAEFINGLASTGIINRLESIGLNLVNQARGAITGFLGNLASTALSGLGLNTTSTFISTYLNKLNKTQPTDIYGKVLITPLNYNMNEICTYTLYNAYPIHLSSINYANDSVGAINEFDCTFYYTHYSIDKPAFGLDSVVNSIKNAIGV